MCSEEEFPQALQKQVVPEVIQLDQEKEGDESKTSSTGKKKHDVKAAWNSNKPTTKKTDNDKKRPKPPPGLSTHIP